MNHHLREYEIGGMALRCLLIAAVITVVWVGCRMVWGAEQAKAPVQSSIVLNHSACPALKSPRSVTLTWVALDHAESMARRQHQDHQGFAGRAKAAKKATGCNEITEICAESWKWQKDDSPEKLWVEFVRCWKQSRSHWSVANRKHKYFGAAMAQGKNGVWYGVIIAGN